MLLIIWQHGDFKMKMDKLLKDMMKTVNTLLEKECYLYYNKNKSLICVLFVVDFGVVYY